MEIISKKFGKKFKIGLANQRNGSKQSLRKDAYVVVTAEDAPKVMRILNIIYGQGRRDHKIQIAEAFSDSPVYTEIPLKYYKQRFPIK